MGQAWRGVVTANMDATLTDFMCEGCVMQHEYKRPSETHWKHTGFIQSCRLVRAPGTRVFVNESACLVSMVTPLCSDSKWLYINLKIWSRHMKSGHWTGSCKGQTEKRGKFLNLPQVGGLGGGGAANRSAPEHNLANYITTQIHYCSAPLLSLLIVCGH